MVEQVELHMKPSKEKIEPVVEQVELQMEKTEPVKESERVNSSERMQEQESIVQRAKEKAHKVADTVQG